MEVLASVLSSVLSSSVVLFFVQRYFSRRDKKEAEAREEREDLIERVNTGLETIRLLSYHRMSQEIERLLDKGFATPAERRVLDEMFANYKKHGWNGDMDARLKKVYALRTDRPDKGSTVK